MVEPIKVGQVYLVIPEGTPSPIQAMAQPLKAEKPDDPEPLEEQHYIFRPNDPFRAPIDEARAIASITASHKPWVRRTWFVLFIVGPLVYGELYALASALGSSSNPIGMFVVANAPIIPLWLIYFFIWRRKVRH